MNIQRQLEHVRAMQQDGSDVPVPVDFLQHLLQVLQEIEKPLLDDQPSIIHPDDETAVHLDHLISAIQNKLIERGAHPNQLLIDAGVYKALY